MITHNKKVKAGEVGYVELPFIFCPKCGGDAAEVGYDDDITYSCEHCQLSFAIKVYKQVGAGKDTDIVILEEVENGNDRS